MSNKHRIEVPGGLYHVNMKAAAGVRAFPDEWHSDHFLALLADELEYSGWTCLGYTLVVNHYHVIIRIDELTLSSGFQRLNSRYARWFNGCHSRRGAFWGRRFYDVIVDSDPHFLELQRYLAWNAPRANLAETPEDWPYCHYGALIGKAPADPLIDEDEILPLFAGEPRRARVRLQQFVEERDPRVRRQTLL